VRTLPRRLARIFMQALPLGTAPVLSVARRKSEKCGIRGRARTRINLYSTREGFYYPRGF
jgi:hypothetical protein